MNLQNVQTTDPARLLGPSKTTKVPAINDHQGRQIQHFDKTTLFYSMLANKKNL